MVTITKYQDGITELKSALTTSQGTLVTSVIQLNNGKYQVVSDWFNTKGEYVPNKHTVRICNNINELCN